MLDTTSDLATLQQLRRDALDETGWGLPFRFLQPRNLCFWTFLVIVTFGAYQAWSSFTPQLGYFLPAIGLSGGVGILFTIAWAIWFRHLDKFERQPWSLLAVAFVWGGFGATFAMAVAANTSLNYLYGKLFGRDFSADWSASLSAPFVEEFAKGAGVLLLMGLARHLVVTVADGVIIGIFVGLGFQALEDFIYSGRAAAAQFGSDQVGVSIHMDVTRAYSDLMSHPLFTAIFGAGVVYLVGTRVQPRRIGRGLLLIATAMLIHGVWDGMVAISGGNPALVYVVLLTVSTVAAVALWWAFEWATRQAAPYAAAVLAPEVATGVVQQPEVDALFGRKARKAFIKSHAEDKRRASKVARWHHRRMIAAVLDLNADLAKSYGEDSADVIHSRAEVERVRAL
ncbi:PrsW family intramembrane metalloprotease [Aeromicrobium choanae]|uniref:Membrane proteinase PrsW, cleaves anti-sigma factor RsiW, M82 family n=1 Tax=Aeromicrobium choanae TaxID=1736691 RepID=A0A1T4Z7F5_9ACTN|nr:PrsW family intramembrane metalloprotease [Aeromicrobium choanae]SKB09505.1 Membrane proteinase PrsW, cleaves anti-sigma factor RsiW, M82 family [Aeromicrobium choanae]